jgi:hypothetical protein
MLSYLSGPYVASIWFFATGLYFQEGNSPLLFICGAIGLLMLMGKGKIKFSIETDSNIPKMKPKPEDDDLIDAVDIIPYIEFSPISPIKQISDISTQSPAEQPVVEKGEEILETKEQTIEPLPTEPPPSKVLYVEHNKLMPLSYLHETLNLLLVNASEFGFEFNKDSIIWFRDLDGKEILGSRNGQFETVAQILQWVKEFPVAWHLYPFVSIDYKDLKNGNVYLDYHSSKTEKDYGI